MLDGNVEAFGKKISSKNKTLISEESVDNIQEYYTFSLKNNFINNTYLPLKIVTLEIL